MAQTLFTIEIVFLHENEVCRQLLRNYTADKLKEVRETIFSAGLMVPVERSTELPAELDHWRVISPWNIKAVEVWRQEKFFKNSK